MGRGILCCSAAVGSSAYDAGLPEASEASETFRHCTQSSGLAASNVGTGHLVLGCRRNLEDYYLHVLCLCFVLRWLEHAKEWQRLETDVLLKH